ncbi:hypothetical protein M5K25_001167 [Dendrobium thyrsiflorum]|uniref:Smr domain-containing protein n=1 Tax=Dendrobium thyrsiflorum TaxID=117978 RepID=A0ABD0VQA1_DENTH
MAGMMQMAEMLVRDYLEDTINADFLDIIAALYFSPSVFYPDLSLLTVVLLIRAASQHSRGASNAYLRRDHLTARRLSLRAREEWMTAEKLNTQAAEEILRIRNSNNDIWMLDLHGLHATEAVHALKQRLQRIESKMMLNHSASLDKLAKLEKIQPSPSFVSLSGLETSSNAERIILPQPRQTSLHVITDIWASYLASVAIVRKSWSRHARVLRALHFWSKAKLKNLTKLKESLKKDISALQLEESNGQGFTSDKLLLLRSKTHEVNVTMARLNTWWRQRAKVKWIQENNMNSKFFIHMLMEEGLLKNDKCIMVEEQTDIENIMIEFFNNKWRYRECCLEGWPPALTTVSEPDCDHLEADFSFKEVEVTWGFPIPVFSSIWDCKTKLELLSSANPFIAKVYCSLVYFSWKSRNKVKHGDHEFGLSFIASNAISFASISNSNMFVDHWGANQPNQLSSSWHPPPPGWIKVNLDASLLKSKEGGIGGVFRDSKELENLAVQPNEGLYELSKDPVAVCCCPVTLTFGYGTLKNPTRGSRAYSPSTHQSDSATSSPHHMAVTHFSASFVETNREHYCGRDHPSLSNIRVAAPPYRSSPSLDGQPSIGSSFGSVSYDSTLGPTPSHLSQPLASPDLDLASVILVEKCIRKKRSPEPETKCIHFMDANDITDNEDFFEDETEVIKLDSLYNLNPDLGVLVPLDLDILVHPDPNPIKDIPLDFCLDDINLISKEADLTLNTLKLNSEDFDLILSPAEMTLNNSDLILDNSDGDVNNLELEVSQTNLLLGLNPDSCDPKSLDLRVMTKPDLTENISINLEGINLTSNNSEPILEDEQSIIFWKYIFGVAPLDLYSTVCVLPDVTYLTIPCTDFNVRDSISPYIPVAFLTIVPAFVLETLTHLLSPIPAGDSLGYPLVVMSHDPSPYRVPDSYILPSISSSFPIKDHLSPSWLTLLDYTTVTDRPSMTLAETSYRNALVAKDVFIAPPTPIPLNNLVVIAAGSVHKEEWEDLSFLEGFAKYRFDDARPGVISVRPMFRYY